MLRKLMLVMLLIAVLIPGVQAQDEPLEDASFFLTFIPNIQFAPIYVAIENGYFADAGLNLTVQYGNEPDGVDLVAAGSLDYGVFSGEQIILSRANQRDVVFVYEWFQQLPIGIVSVDSANISTVADLTGQRLGVPGRFGASYSGLIALLASAGMVETDIQLEEIGFNAPEVICVGAIESSVVYINNEPLQIQERIDQGDCGAVTGLTVLPVSSSVDMVSNGLVTSAAAIAEKPEEVQMVVTAFHNGLQDTINNPAQAYLLSAAHVENLLTDETLRSALEAEAATQAEFLATEPDRAAITESRSAMLARLAEQFDSQTLVQFQVLLNTIELWDADQLGLTDIASWETTQQTLLTMGFIQEPIDLEAAFTNDFLGPR